MYQHPVVLVQYFTNLMRHQQIDTDSFLVYSSSRLRIEIAALENTVPRLLRLVSKSSWWLKNFSFATVVFKINKMLIREWIDSRITLKLPRLLAC